MDVQISWVNGEWVVGTKTMMRANESTFGGTTKLAAFIWERLSAYKVTPRRLSKSNIYTFRVTGSAFGRIESPQAIYYVSSFDKTT